MIQNVKSGTWADVGLSKVAAIRHQSVCVRLATLEDAAEIAKLGRSIFTLCFAHSCTEQQLEAYVDEAYTTEAISRDLEDPNKLTIVAADQDGAIVGFSLLTAGSIEPCVAHLSKIVELQRLYVHPNYHGNGVGKVLTRTVEEIARQVGFEHMWLGVWEGNFKAQKVYEKLGYELIGDHIFDLGGDLQTDLIVWKKL